MIVSLEQVAGCILLAGSPLTDCSIRGAGLFGFKTVASRISLWDGVPAKPIKPVEPGTFPGVLDLSSMEFRKFLPCGGFA